MGAGLSEPVPDRAAVVHPCHRVRCDPEPGDDERVTEHGHRIVVDRPIRCKRLRLGAHVDHDPFPPQRFGPGGVNLRIVIFFGYPRRVAIGTHSKRRAIIQACPHRSPEAYVVEGPSTGGQVVLLNCSAGTGLILNERQVVARELERGQRLFDERTTMVGADPNPSTHAKDAGVVGTVTVIPRAFPFRFEAPFDHHGRPRFRHDLFPDKGRAGGRARRRHSTESEYRADQRYHRPRCPKWRHTDRNTPVDEKLRYIA